MDEPLQFKDPQGYNLRFNDSLGLTKLKRTILLIVTVYYSRTQIKICKRKRDIGQGPRNTKFPMELCRQCLFLPARMCDNMELHNQGSSLEAWCPAFLSRVWNVRKGNNLHDLISLQLLHMSSWYHMVQGLHHIVSHTVSIGTLGWPKSPKPTKTLLSDRIFQGLTGFTYQALGKGQTLGSWVSHSLVSWAIFTQNNTSDTNWLPTIHFNSDTK